MHSLPYPRTSQTRMRTVGDDPSCKIVGGVGGSEASHSGSLSPSGAYLYLSLAWSRVAWKTGDWCFTIIFQVSLHDLHHHRCPHCEWDVVVHICSTVDAMELERQMEMEGMCANDILWMDLIQDQYLNCMPDNKKRAINTHQNVKRVSTAQGSSNTWSREILGTPIIR